MLKGHAGDDSLLGAVLSPTENHVGWRYTRWLCKPSTPCFPLGGSCGPSKPVGRAAIDAGRKVWLGRYDTEGAASMACDRAALRHFGDYAAVNFPDSANCVPCQEWTQWYPTAQNKSGDLAPGIAVSHCAPMVSPPGIEPGTCGLKVRCSTI